MNKNKLIKWLVDKLDKRVDFLSNRFIPLESDVSDLRVRVSDHDEHLCRTDRPCDADTIQNLKDRVFELEMHRDKVDKSVKTLEDVVRPVDIATRGFITYNDLERLFERMVKIEKWRNDLNIDPVGFKNEFEQIHKSISYTQNELGKLKQNTEWVMSGDSVKVKSISFEDQLSKHNTQLNSINQCLTNLLDRITLIEKQIEVMRVTAANHDHADVEQRLETLEERIDKLDSSVAFDSIRSKSGKELTYGDVLKLLDRVEALEVANKSTKASEPSLLENAVLQRIAYLEKEIAEMNGDLNVQ